MKTYAIPMEGRVFQTISIEVSFPENVIEKSYDAFPNFLGSEYYIEKIREQLQRW